jgi:hypothetical protein
VSGAFIEASWLGHDRQWRPADPLIALEIGGRGQCAAAFE